jgi:tetratricopeptide (TPR) repeat protein
MSADIRDLEAQRDFLLQSIEDLDREHVSGALEDQEYVDLRDQHVVRAASVLRALQGVETLTVQPPRLPPKAKVAASWMRSRQKSLWILGVAALVGAGVFGIATVVDHRSAGETITGNSADSAASLLQEAQQETAKGSVADAVKTYDKVLRIDANNVQAMTYRGWLLHLAGLSDDGLRSIERAIALQPTYPDAHFFKGYILLNTKQDANGAVTEFHAFLDNNPPQEMVSLVQEALKDAEARAAVGVPAP